jgi:hypothetical protein
MICEWIPNSNFGATLAVGQVCALAIRDTAGSAAALAARCKNVRRGSFMASRLQVNIILISAPVKGAAASADGMDSRPW